MATAHTPPIHRDWIASEFSKGIDAEQSLVDESKARSLSPPDASMGALYHEIATADERHRQIVETIATRYGHTPTRSVAGGIGETLTRLKEKVSEVGSTPLQRLSHDLTAKATAVHWYNAWIATFEAIGDNASADELSAVLTEEQAHLDALQKGLNRMVTRGALGEGTAAK